MRPTAPAGTLDSMNPTLIGWLVCADITFDGTRYRSGTLLTDEALATSMRESGVPIVEVDDEDDQLLEIIDALNTARAQDASADFAQFIIPLVKDALDETRNFFLERFGVFGVVASFNPRARVGSNSVQTRAGEPLRVELPIPPSDPWNLLGARVLLTRVAYDGGVGVVLTSPSGQPIGFSGDATAAELDISGYSSVELTFSTAHGYVDPPSYYWHVTSVVPFPT